MRHRVPVAQLNTEEGYFHRMDAERMDELRKQAARDEEHRRMAAASHIEDPKLLEALEELGYTHTTLNLLFLVPVVELAWIDGSVSAIEHDLILAEAKGRGVEEGSPAFAQLQAWLEQRPPDAFFEGTWRVIEAVLASLTEDEQETRKKSLLQSSAEFAAGSGQHLVWANWVCASKRKLLRATEERLKRRHEAVPHTAHAA